METRANYVLVGVSVLVAVFAIVAFAFWLGHSEFNKQEDTYYTYFTGSVTGLSSGGAVRYRGIPVGTVDTLEIDPDNIERIRVTLKIRKGTPVKTDSVAALEVAGITGGAYINLTGGTQSSPLLIDTGDGNIPVIRAENSSLQALVMDAPKLLQKLNDLADRANQVLSQDNIHAISDTFTHLANVSASLDAMTPDIKRTLANIDQLSVDLHTKLPPLLDSVRQGTVSLTNTSDEFRKMATNINSVIDENRVPLRNFTTNGLSEVTSLITELRTLSNTLTRVADNLDRDPQRYLFGGSTRSGIDPNRPLSAGVPTGGSR